MFSGVVTPAGSVVDVVKAIVALPVRFDVGSAIDPLNPPAAGRPMVLEADVIVACDEAVEGTLVGWVLGTGTGVVPPPPPPPQDANAIAERNSKYRSRKNTCSNSI